MTFELRAVGRHRVYANIVDQIVEGVQAGAFPPGRALPAERDLAATLGVGRSSLREAIRVLEHAGVLDVRTGRGTYVSEGGVSKAAMLRVRAAAVGEQSPLDVVAARMAVEPVCAELAALHRRRSDLEALRDNVRDQSAANELGQEPEDIDFAFHLAVSSATDNPVLSHLVEGLVDIMRQGTWRDLKHRARSRDNGADRYLEQHRAIHAAIERRDPASAFAAMRAHLESISAGLLAEIK